MFVVALLAVPSGVHAADSTWTIDDFGSDITVGNDGTISVVETIKVNFITPHHGIFRYVVTDLPYDSNFDRVYQVIDQGVLDPNGADVNYQTQTQGGYFEYIFGIPAILLTGPQTYVLKYEVIGALDEFGGHDELAWHVMGSQWPVGATHVHATVHMPTAGPKLSGSCLEGTISSSSPCRLSGSGPSIVYSADRALHAGEDIRIAADFPMGLVPTPKPMLFRTLPGYFNHGPVNILAALAALGIGLGLIVWYWSRGRRNTAPTVVEFTPPENFRAAQLGLILDEIPDTKDVTATILDFASRGYLTIQDTGDGDWTLSRRTGADGLQPYEIALFQGLFNGRDVVKVSELSGTFVGTLHAAENALATDAMQRRWFTSDPRSVAVMWHFFGVAAVLAGAGLTWWLGYSAGFSLVGVAIIVVGIFLFAAGGDMPKRSAVGTDVLEHTLGFRLYMNTAEKYRQQFAERADIFTLLLPYAIVFGCCDRWANAFAGLAAQPPGWYIDSQRPFDPVVFSRRMQHFHTVVSSSVTYVPHATPRSSGYSGFLGGGGGGSRGGFSGGGGGGGGGAW